MRFFIVVTQTSVYLFKYLTRSDNIYIRKKMRMQLALITLVTCFFMGVFSSNPPDKSNFLIFSNDGTFYKLSPEEQHVHWHSDLGSKLISFEIQEAETNFQNDLSAYFIPTIEGHFVYIDKTTEILVHREEIQPLLKICFGKSHGKKDIGLTPQQQYFLHQKYEYFFIDLHNGKLWNIESFFQEKVVVKQGRHGLIKVSKKFLKQLKPNLDVKWSIISSTIDIISATQFLRDPKSQIQAQEASTREFEFRRTSNSEMEVLNVLNGKSFHMGTTSPILRVFSCEQNGTLFKKYPISFYKKPVLAIQDKKEKQAIQVKNQIMNAGIDVFPHSAEYKNSNKSNRKHEEIHQAQKFDFEYCLNTFRAIKQLHDNANILTNVPFISKKLQIGNKYEESEQVPHYHSPTEQISPASHPHLFQVPQRSKQQPLIWIFIIGSLVVSGVLFYRFKVGKLLVELEKIGNQHDKRFQEIQKKLGQFEQMQKMYEVNWDKLLYRKPRRKTSDVYIQQTELGSENVEKKERSSQIEMYEHLVFQGRFLNKEALVYAVPMQGIDLIHVQHQLNDLLSCSHKSLIKLYYYTKNSQFLLIFCEKINPLWQGIESSSFFDIFQDKKDERKFKNIENLLVSQLPQNEELKNKSNESLKEISKNKKLSKQETQKISNFLIKQIIECLTYLDSKIQIFSCPLEGVIINNRCLAISEKDPEKSVYNFQVELKINTIPSILQVYKLQDEQSEEEKLRYKHQLKLKLRHDLVKIFYFVNSKGQKASINSIYSMITKEQNSVEENFFVRDFYDFVLNENYNLNIEIDINERTQPKEEEKKVRVIGINYQFLQRLTCHPFLWDSKRKILFLTDFSNYIETYLDDFKIKKLQSYARDYQIIDTPWTKHLDIAFVREVNQFRKYDYNSVKDLIRLIRNKLNHFHEIPKETRNSIGKTPEAFIQYMLKLYPKLLSFAFVYAKKKKWKLHVQMK